MTNPADEDWTDAAEEDWGLQARPKVIEYLKARGVTHGDVGDLPAWDTVPLVSIWAVASLARPGAVGWWVIYGDLPTNYCSGEECRHPRLALRRIVERWRAELAKCKPGDEVIGSTGILASYASLLDTRAKILLGFADDDGLWPAEVYG
jgi:hypothetical protein